MVPDALPRAPHSDFPPKCPGEWHQRLSPHAPRPLAARRSPHPAANRLVQKAFRIGVPMRKTLSIFRRPGHETTYVGHGRFDDCADCVALGAARVPRATPGNLASSAGHAAARRGDWSRWTHECRPDLAVNSTNGEQSRSRGQSNCLLQYNMRIFLILHKTPAPFFRQTDRILLAGMGNTFFRARFLGTLCTVQSGRGSAEVVGSGQRDACDACSLLSVNRCLPERRDRGVR